MEALSKLTVNPFDAVAGLMESVLPGTPPANATTAAASTPNATFTEDTLRMIVHNLFTGDSRLQGQMLSKYWAQDASYTLNEGALTLPDRDSLAQLLRGVQLLARVEPEVLEITSTPGRAVILLNLSLSYNAVPLTWTRYTRIQVPTTLSLTFAPDPSAVIAATDDVVTELRQEMSLPDLLWWNPAWTWVNSRLWGPVSGRVLSQLVQLQDPFVSRFQEYLAGGAGYMQALIWLAQDAASGMPARQHPVAPPPHSSDLLAAAAGAAAPDNAAAAAAAAATPAGPKTPGRVVAVAVETPVEGLAVGDEAPLREEAAGMPEVAG